MQCPICHHTHPDNARFCPNTGESLIDPNQAYPSPPDPPSEQPLPPIPGPDSSPAWPSVTFTDYPHYCHACQTQLSPGGESCENCGKPVGITSLTVGAIQLIEGINCCVAAWLPSQL